MYKDMEIKYDADNHPYVIQGNVKIKMDLDNFTDNFYKNIATKELRETLEEEKKALKELRVLLKAEKDLNVPLDDDKFLIKFLRPCKFYAESAFQKMKSYYAFRRDHAEYCHDLVPSKVKIPFESGVVSILSPRDRHGRACMLVESGEVWNHRQMPVADWFRGIQLGLETVMTEPKTQVCGVIIIFDMKGLSFNQVVQFTPIFGKMVVDYLQDCVPIRLKGIHVINQPYIFNMMFAIFKPFLREKLRSRIHFHGTNRASLLAHVNPEALRTRHGGTMPAPEIPGTVLWKVLMHYDEVFKRADMVGYSPNAKK